MPGCGKLSLLTHGEASPRQATVEAVGEGDGGVEVGAGTVQEGGISLCVDRVDWC